MDLQFLRSDNACSTRDPARKWERAYNEADTSQLDPSDTIAAWWARLDAHESKSSNYNYTIYDLFCY